MIKPLTEKKQLEPLKLSRDAVIQHMQNLRNAEVFEVLYGLWASEREALIAEGKKSRKDGLWDELAGFDRATNMVFLWASKKMTTETEKEEYALPGEET